MPQKIVSVGGTSFGYRDYELPELGPRDVRVRTEFAAPKHGTESHAIRGSAFDRKRWDGALRMFLPRDEPAEPPPAVTNRASGESATW